MMNKNPQVNVNIDTRPPSSASPPIKSRARSNYAYGSTQVYYLTPTNQYWVILEVLPQYQQDPVVLGLLYIKSMTGTVVPLRAVATITKGVGPVTIQPLRTASVGDAVVQPRAERLARNRDGRSAAAREPDSSAGHRDALRDRQAFR